MTTRALQSSVVGLAFPGRSTEEPETNHHVQDNPGTSGSTIFISHTSRFSHQSKSYLQVQKHFSIFISLQEFILSSNNSAMEQSTQGRCWSAISELLPESFAAIAHLCVFRVGIMSHREFANYVPEPGRRNYDYNCLPLPNF